MRQIALTESSFLLGSCGLLLCLLSTTAAAQQAPIEVGRFSSSSLEGWKEKEFDGLTRYRFVSSEGKTVLESNSERAASALYHEVTIDLNKTPLLNWSWRKNTTLDPGDETSKSGDDFVARLYVIRKGGLRFWKTRAINYVWSFQHRKGTAWDNPFAGSKARMFAVRDASDPRQTWFRESRDVQRDFRELLGEDIDSIDGIAIMSDSDNSGKSASAMFGDIYFSAR